MTNKVYAKIDRKDADNTRNIHRGTCLRNIQNILLNSCVDNKQRERHKSEKKKISFKCLVSVFVIKHCVRVIMCPCECQCCVSCLGVCVCARAIENEWVFTLYFPRRRFHSIRALEALFRSITKGICTVYLCIFIYPWMNKMTVNGMRAVLYPDERRHWVHDECSQTAVYPSHSLYGPCSFVFTGTNKMQETECVRVCVRVERKR